MADTLLSFGVIDDAGATKRVPVFLPASMTLAQITGFSDLFAALLNDAIDGVIQDVQVTFNIAVPGGLRTTPVADSTVRRGADLTFSNASRYKWPLYVPAWSLTLITGGDIDIADPNASDLISAYVDGLTFSSVLYQPLNGSAFDLTALSKSKEAFRK